MVVVGLVVELVVGVVVEVVVVGLVVLKQRGVGTTRMAYEREMSYYFNIDNIDNKKQQSTNS